MAITPEQFLPDATRASAVARVFAHLRKHPSNVVASMVKEMAIAGDVDVLSDLLDANVLQNSGFNNMAVGYGILPLLEVRGIEAVRAQAESLVNRWLVSFQCDDVSRMSDYLQFVDDEATTRQLLARGANPNSNMSRMRGPLPVAEALAKREDEIPWLMLKAIKERNEVPLYKKGGVSIFKALLQNIDAFGMGRHLEILERMRVDGMPDVWREAIGNDILSHGTGSDLLFAESTAHNKLHAKLISLARFQDPAQWLRVFEPNLIEETALAAMTIPTAMDGIALEAIANAAREGADLDKVVVQHPQLNQTTFLLSATYHRNAAMMQVLLEAGCDPYKTCRPTPDEQDLNAFEIADLRFSPETTQVLGAWRASQAIKGVLEGARKERAPAP
jgi:hypothetical protein